MRLTSMNCIYQQAFHYELITLPCCYVGIPLHKFMYQVKYFPIYLHTCALLLLVGDKVIADIEFLLGQSVSCSVGANFTPHIIIVGAGEVRY